MSNIKNIVDNFEQMVNDASQELNDAGACYLRYCAFFTNEERNIIDKFRADFKDKGNDITKVFANKEEYTDEKINVIHKFVRFSESKFTSVNHEFLERFERIVKRAREGRIYARHCIMRYADMFTTKERNLIDNFKIALNGNDDITKVFKERAYTDEQIYVIDRFIGFVEGLPMFRFTGWLRWLFSWRRSARRRKMEKLRKKKRATERLDFVFQQKLISELDYQLQLKKLDEKYD